MSAFIFCADNLTYEEVQPTLDGMSTKLSDVEDTIANVTDMFKQIDEVGIGFVNVSFQQSVI